MSWVGGAGREGFKKHHMTNDGIKCHHSMIENRMSSLENRKKVMETHFNKKTMRPIDVQASVH